MTGRTAAASARCERVRRGPICRYFVVKLSYSLALALWLVVVQRGVGKRRSQYVVWVGHDSVLSPSKALV